MLGFLWALLLTAAAEKPPTTIVEPVAETLHGEQIADPYRWLEGTAAPELEGDDAELTERVSAWTDAQNEYTRSVLDALPGRSQLRQRIDDLQNIAELATPKVRGNRYFYYSRGAGRSQWVVHMRDGAEGADRVILDVTELDESGLTALSFFTPDPKGKIAAFGTFRAGDENTVLNLMDLDTGRWLSDEIPGRAAGVDWFPDGSGFLYERLADPENPFSRQVKVHWLGQHHREDPVLFEQEKEGPLATTFGPFGYLSRDARWLILGYWTGTRSNDLWVVDFDHWRRTGEVERRAVVTGEDAVCVGPVIGDTLYLETTLGAPNGRVLAVDLHNPDRENWREVVPEQKDAVLENLTVSRGYLVAQYLDKVTTRVERYRYDGTYVGPLELPGLGQAKVTASSSRTEAFVLFSSYHRPMALYRADMATGKIEPWIAPESAVDPEALELRQVFYPSKDGTRVSLFLLHKKGLELDGARPTLLGGYGGFGVSLKPSFVGAFLSWVEAGGVYAVANLRGGGEFGEAWHRAGMLDQKQNVFDDMIAGAEWLIREGYTSPSHLAIRGGSNGGLLTGAALVQRPDLFSAVVSKSPLLDMLRYQHFLMARFWVPEYGSSDDPEQFATLRDYSPYHNIKAKTAYPAVLLVTGENDSRVHPLHARKMAARLQAATSSDPRREPILLWVHRDSGHGLGNSLDHQREELTDEILFLAWQLGLELPAS